MASLLEQKMEDAEMSLKDLVNKHAFGDGTGNGGKDLSGLQLMVSAAGTYGNIDRAEDINYWWRAQVVNGAGALAVSGAVGMVQMYNDCGSGQGSMTPDGILTSQDQYQNYETNMLSKFRYTAAAEANRVFANDNMKFRRAMLMWDHECPKDRMYFLNSKVIKYLVNTGKDFQMRPFQIPPNQDSKTAHRLLYCQLVCRNCRHLGLIHGLT